MSATLPGDRVVSAEIDGSGRDADGDGARLGRNPGRPARAAPPSPGGTAGQVTTIQILLKDAQGNPVEGRRDAIAVAISGANTVNKVPVTESGGGTYTASYTPQKSGSDAIGVEVLGTSLTGSLTSTVIAGPPSRLTSSVDMPSRVTVFPNRAPGPPDITAFDALGNRITRGGANFEVRVEDEEEGPPLDLTDNRDGTYSASFNPGTGVFLVHVRLDGDELKDSPYQLIVSFF